MGNRISAAFLLFQDDLSRPIGVSRLLTATPMVRIFLSQAGLAFAVQLAQYALAPQGVSDDFRLKVIVKGVAS